MKHISTITTALLTAGLMAFTGMASADIVADMSRISANSGGGGVVNNTVRINCGGGDPGDPSTGNVFANASATLHATQDTGGTTQVKIMVKNTSPNTLMTVWVRQKGDDQDLNSFGGAPLTGGGATPLAPSSALGALTDAWIDNSGLGTLTGANAFTTNAQGKGTLFVTLDYALEGGHYPHNNISAASLNKIRLNKNANALATPTAIVDPRQTGVSGPFLIRMVSHCLDGRAHGLSPAAREPWFQFP